MSIPFRYYDCQILTPDIDADIDADYIRLSGFEVKTRTNTLYGKTNTLYGKTNTLYGKTNTLYGKTRTNTLYDRPVY